MENPLSEGCIGLQELKKLMQRLNLKTSTSALKERFCRHDKRNSGVIGFDDFAAILGEVVFEAGLFRDHFAKLFGGGGAEADASRSVLLLLKELISF